jgi:hypothetical protein
VIAVPKLPLHTFFFSSTYTFFVLSSKKKGSKDHITAGSTSTDATPMPQTAKEHTNEHL